MPFNQSYEEIEPWACEAGCGYFCDLVSVETSQGFLRLKYRCPSCGGKATRYYDLQDRGYVEAMGVRCEGSRNERNFVGSQLCAGTMHCPRKEFKKFFRLGVELEDCIDEIAKMVCPGLGERQLRRCFATLLDPNAHEPLRGRFLDVYNQAGRGVPREGADGMSPSISS